MVATIEKWERKRAVHEDYILPGQNEHDGRFDRTMIEQSRSRVSVIALV